MKTAELTGLALDWAVAQADGLQPHTMGTAWCIRVTDPRDGSIDYCEMPQYSIDWAHGSPIIERAWLDITPWPNESDENLRWQCHQHDNIDCVMFGPTPLIAAMRCYVASKLGDDVNVPDGLAE